MSFRLLGSFRRPTRLLDTRHEISHWLLARSLPQSMPLAVSFREKEVSNLSCSCSNVAETDKRIAIQKIENEPK